MSAVGKTPLLLKELRFHLSSNGKSVGLKNYITQNYKTIQQSNPSLSILIREGLNTPSAVYGRFDHGQEIHFVADNLDQNTIQSRINEIITKTTKK